jgi:hypothetical protein
MQELALTVPITLLGAAQLLRDRGWTTRQMEHPDGRMCLVGAIQRYVAERRIDDPVVADNLSTDAVAAVQRVIWELFPDKPHLTAWNDRHCASAADAIDILERAARTAA